MISSTVIQGTVSAAPVVDTVFKGRHLYVSWGVRGAELRRAAEPPATAAAREALSAVCGHAAEPRLREVFIASQSAVAITVHRMLSNAGSGDAVFFLCDSQIVVDWLLAVLTIEAGVGPAG